MAEMQLYEYNGPVLVYGRFIENWKGRTMAVSEKAAKRNLSFQWKESAGRAANVPVTLPDRLKLLEKRVKREEQTWTNTDQMRMF